MTLGELRKLTAELPDETVFVDTASHEADYDLEISREYGRQNPQRPMELIRCTLFLGEQ